ncbi:ABC transporter ATP-binding protein [Pararhodonellum marinum]|uniref:ABC transporter ATP-binding protein n=1 Tax=Pararhodonellum marinum TaxID=2755358 RepID=UPI0018909841|nr:ATP-binding cassette domain-containing protein [Pararhodonellum marinum]
MKTLEVIQLSKKYGKTPALTDINLEIPQGSIFGLLGPNGAGKTTLIRIINQIIEGDSGDILIQGERLQPKHISRIGYLPEERGLYKKMKVGEQLLYFAQLKGMPTGEARQKVEEWLRRLDIHSWKEKKIEDLSKGMAQKIQFISTVIHSPEILILDEPFSGFDPVNAELIKNEILELKSLGTTVILSTHRMESVELLCDHIAMIHRSFKVLDGPVKEVKLASKPHEFLAKIKKNGKPLPANWQYGVETEDYASFLIPLNGQSPNQILGQAMEYGEILGFEEIIPSIEEIFMEKVKEDTHE